LSFEAVWHSEIVPMLETSPALTATTLLKEVQRRHPGSYDDALLRTQGSNLLLFGPPGVGKSHLVCAIGNGLTDRGYRVHFTRTSYLVQRLQVARSEMRLPAEIARLDRFDLLILDDLSYVRRDQAETSVLFEQIAARYERKSRAITANQPFSGWDQVFPEVAMTLAAVDRLMHDSTIFELNVESYRRRTAATAQIRAGAKPTPKNH
jgi:DNA replication protein DnaC